MKKRNLFAIALVLGLAFTLMVGLSVSAQNQDGGQQNPDRAQEPAAPPPIDPFEGGEQAMGALGVAETVSHTFSYQGVLEEDGQPVTGDREMIFHLYNNEACTNTVGSPMTYTVAVDDGLFSVDLAFDQANFNGQALWLEAEVEGTPLGCQTVQAVPYALSLRPGALISGSASFDTPIMLHVRYGSSDSSSQGAVGGSLGVWALIAGYGVYGYNNVSGWGVYGEAESDLIGWGVQGDADAPGGAGVYGRTFYTNTASYGVQGEAISSNGFGGYFRNAAGAGTEGVAVRGLSASGAAGDAHPFGFYYDAAGEFAGPNGIIGAASDDANDGYGVIGFAQGTSGRGVYGYAITTTGTTYGVWGESLSENGIGVYGNAPSSVGDPNTPIGVYGRTGSSDGFPVVGLQTGYSMGDIQNWVEPGGFFAGGNGLVAVTNNDGGVALAADHNVDQAVAIAVRGETAASTDNYGLYTDDNLYSQNYNLAGAIMQMVQNGGDQTLEAGDVVVFSGMADPLKAGGPPVILVSKAGAANSTAVAGVVHSRFDSRIATGDFGEEGSQALSEAAFEGPIAPGDYLLLVVQGPAQVKASGSIQAGDLLSSAGQAGYAAKAAELSIEGVTIAAPGTVFGKALEALDEEDGLIYVFVTLQ